jgi:hypothetical protein
LHQHVEVAQRVHAHTAADVISVDEVEPESFANEDERLRE